MNQEILFLGFPTMTGLAVDRQTNIIIRLKLKNNETPRQAIVNCPNLHWSSLEVEKQLAQADVLKSPNITYIFYPCTHLQMRLQIMSEQWEFMLIPPEIRFNKSELLSYMERMIDKYRQQTSSGLEFRGPFKVAQNYLQKLVFCAGQDWPEGPIKTLVDMYCKVPLLYSWMDVLRYSVEHSTEILAQKNVFPFAVLVNKLTLELRGVPEAAELLATLNQRLV